MITNNIIYREGKYYQNLYGSCKKCDFYKKGCSDVICKSDHNWREVTDRGLKINKNEN